MRPALRWHGGKFRLAPWILGHFPEAHTVYVEPYGGGASVLMRKPRRPGEVYNDLDGTVVNVFRVLRDPQSASELRRRLELTPYSRAEFNWSYEAAVDGIDSAHKVIVRSFMGFGSDSVTRGCRTGFRARMTDERAFAASAWVNYVAAVDDFTRRLMGVVIEQAPALDILSRYDSPLTLTYLDPPYVQSTRSSIAGRQRLGRSAGSHGYSHEMDDADHADMLLLAGALCGFVVVSGYRSEIYDKMLAGWRRVDKVAMADGARERVECLWLNPSTAAALDREAAERARRPAGLFEAAE